MEEEEEEEEDKKQSIHGGKIATCSFVARETDVRRARRKTAEASKWERTSGDKSRIKMNGNHEESTP